MTGGSLPAMTFKRLMDYAEQGIEHRAIPGIENPLPGPDAKKKGAEVAVAKPDDENALPPLVRPRSLSSDVTRLLKSIAEKFNTAAPLKAPADLPGKVAEIDLQSTGEIVKGGRNAGR